MFVYFLLISVLIPALSGARLEVCVCCSENTDQTISEQCEIPAKSLTEDEVVTLHKLCREQKALQDQFTDSYGYRQYDAPQYLNYISLQKSIVRKPRLPIEDCESVKEGKWFWIPGKNQWTGRKYRDDSYLLARKIVMSNDTSQSIYQFLGFNGLYNNVPFSSNPILEIFNGTYEFLLRITPAEQTLHDIKFTGSRIVDYTKEFMTFGRIYLNSGWIPYNYKNYITTPKRTYYSLNKKLTDNSHFVIHDENDVFNMGTEDSSKTLREDLEVKEINTFTEDFIHDGYSRGKFYGHFVNTESKFTAKLRSGFFAGRSEAIFTTEEEVEGSKMVSEIELMETEFEFAEPTLEVNDHVIAGLLFTLAAVLTICLIFFVLKKACCCCCRDRVTTGYQRMEERIVG
ncbi:uncharacterized protein LOC132255757 [Phlebotomus argentipes]|uniref:uncharacterized protein LOC132255757 n=1 Tax=Phlebotomus argentipes TaxID=94469 RepID=UPI0028934809|nr:uncharacterized protein LOC132255757 [Phlebotomus argentipes]